MKSKDKMKKHTKLTLKNILTFLAFSIILLFLLAIYDYYAKKDEVFAKETFSNLEQNQVKISSANETDIENIINENTKNNEREEYITEEQELEYIKNISKILSYLLE